MLFEVNEQFTELTPLGFDDLESLGGKEKQLENLIAMALFDVLYEGEPLLPFYQEQSFEGVGDIYALNRDGDVIIFELKRSSASGDALTQILRYSQLAGKWRYEQLDHKFRQYLNRPNGATNTVVESIDLKQHHKSEFGLSEVLPESDFNRRRHCYIVGSAADQGLIDGVRYWQSEGLSIDFVPYRLYRIGGKSYFEFFAKPFDIHSNPNHRKGCIFDTCKKFYPKNLEWMLNKNRVSAFGDQKHVVNRLNKGDFVFLSHRGLGVVAAAEVTSRIQVEMPSDLKDEEHYVDVKFLTPKPTNSDSPSKFLAFSDVSKSLDQSFFWARTIKTPYLSVEQSKTLLELLNKLINEDSDELF